MRSCLKVIAGLVAATMLPALSVVGCSDHPKSSAPTSGSTTSPQPQAQPGDYTRLLIKVSDIEAPDTFTASPPVNNPNGTQGATVTFSESDHSHAIVDTIQVLPDPAAAANALDSARGIQHEALLAKPMSVDVGVDGTTISGLSQDHSKGITMLLFTRGKAFVSIEFDGPPAMLAPSDFVANIGHKQDEAIKKGLGG